jgi:hypothetical protein
MYTKSQILERMSVYSIEGGGIGGWLTDTTGEAVFDRLAQIDEQPLSAVQLNQLLVLGHEAPVTDGFYRYYWLELPTTHPYDVRALTAVDPTWLGAEAILSLDHLAWGVHRLYVDGLLYFGNVRTAFRSLREQSVGELRAYFRAKCLDTQAIKRRGPALPLMPIEKHARYLISEMACKSYGADAQLESRLRTALIQGYELHRANENSAITIEGLLEKYLPADLEGKRVELVFSASEILKEKPASAEDVERLYLGVAQKFNGARQNALKNTELYLSMLTDLDVYVATSMRTRENFVSMAENCEAIFQDAKLRSLNLRYFDPTLSAASGHEDKGLIECLMVKCSKALVYCRGENESYGKDAEAAMALSLGRPVIFYCEKKADFYRETHPLTRLIDFQTGVAVGAMIAETLQQVVDLLSRIFENRMVYRLERTKSGALRLIEEITRSVVRLQTGDKLLTETFWNHYHLDRNRRRAPTAAAVISMDSLRETRTQSAPTRPNQKALPIDDRNTVTQIAARSAASRHPFEVRKGAQRAVAEAPPPLVDPITLTTREIYDAIAERKSNQATGAKRCEIFTSWLESEPLSVSEGIRLLRFIEETLAVKKAAAHFVYTKSDLARWYREMSDGEVTGS